MCFNTLLLLYVPGACGGGGYIHAMVNVWKPEGHSVEMTLAFHFTWVPELCLRLSDLCGKCLDPRSHLASPTVHVLLCSWNQSSFTSLHESPSL